MGGRSTLSVECVELRFQRCDLRLASVRITAKSYESGLSASSEKEERSTEERVSNALLS